MVSYNAVTRTFDVTSSDWLLFGTYSLKVKAIANSGSTNLISEELTITLKLTEPCDTTAIQSINFSQGNCTIGEKYL